VSDLSEEEPIVRGVAVVPGALSVPRRPPVRPVPPPTVLFEQVDEQVDEPADEPVAPVSIRAPAPARSDGAAEPGESPKDPVRNRSLGRRAALPAAAAALAAFVAGTAYVALAGRGGPAGPDSDLGRWAASASVSASAAAAATVTQAAGNAGRPPGDPFGEAAVAVSGVPTRVRVAAIGLDSSLEALHVADGALVPPKGFDRAGWYAEGTAPGDVGPAVIAGHVDSQAGPAVFYRLRELIAGDTIEVVRGGTVLRFTVTRTAWYRKSAFPTEQVYGPTPDRQLRLITCGGVFNHKLRSYRDNLVVYAVAG
jgi:hypothetical protein